MMKLTQLEIRRIIHEMKEGIIYDSHNMTENVATTIYISQESLSRADVYHRKSPRFRHPRSPQARERESKGRI